MSLPYFDVLQPETVAEACQLLEQHSKEGASVLAGGTDILVDIRVPMIPEHLPRCKGCDIMTGMPQKYKDAPAYMIALSRIPELQGIEELPTGDIVIGAMTSITEISKSSLVRDKLQALSEGCDNLGSPLVRNRGTIGGNICNARPAADAVIPSYALRAKLELTSPKGTRTVDIQDFITGPGRTIRENVEILTKVIFPKPENRSGSCCIKIANRKALEIAVVNAASVIVLDEAGKVAEVRIALGAVAPTPILAPVAAESLIGKIPSTVLLEQAGETAATECKPISDHRGTKPYRVDMVEVLVKRTLEGALKNVG
jgi:carbon-monoxide dehydrogenase medium subunit